MEDSEKRKLIRRHIHQHQIAVLSTVDNGGKPESAVIEYGDTDDLELIFDTFVSYRKYRNLMTNKRVSFVIGWDKNITVQYEGEAHELYDQELLKYQEQYFQKNPKAKKWVSKEGIRFFLVVPSWIRYSDLNENPWRIVEIDFGKAQ